MCWKSTRTCRTCTPTSISTRRRWRPSSADVRVLGIDCGSARTGYGIIDSDGQRHRLVAGGTICTNARLPFEKRLLKIANELRALLREHAPDRAAVEGVFCSANARTALK